jgi:hypothetical protein
MREETIVEKAVSLPLIRRRAIEAGFTRMRVVPLKICDLEGNVLREDLGRTSLPRDVAPGEEIEIDMTVAGVPESGRFELRYDMVVEGVTWFEFQGSPCLRRTLEVSS